MSNRPDTPLLDTANTPAELRKLPATKLRQVADELRAEIELVSVHVDLATHRPAPLPDGYAAAFAALDRQAA